MSKSGKITMRQIAERVGCSTAAVSYAIRRNRPLSEDLKKRIWAVIDELGYRPYGVSSSFQFMPVAVLADDVSETLIHRFRDELWRRKMLMQLYLLSPKICWKTFESICGSFQQSSSRLTGIINLHPGINSFDLLKYCKNIPSVIYYREGSMCSHVTLRLEEIGKLAARHLLPQKHSQAALLIFRNEESVYSDQVYLAMESYLQRKRPEFQLHKIALDPEKIPVQLERIYADGIRIFCSHGVTVARPALQWAYATHRRIPDNLSFLCLDYSDTAAELSPPLSSIALPQQQLVHYTVDELITLIHHKQPETHMFFPYFVDRGSMSVEYSFNKNN